MATDPSWSATPQPAAGPSAARPATRCFEDFYRQELAEVVGLLQSLGASQHLAQDAVQDAFLEAQRHWDQICCYERPGAWVRKVAVQRLQHARRRQQREPTGIAQMNRGPSPAQEPSLEAVAEHADVWRAIRALPKRQAQVIVLHYTGDLRINEIAGVLGISSGSVKTHLHHARQALAEQLADQE